MVFWELLGIFILLFGIFYFIFLGDIGLLKLDLFMLLYLCFLFLIFRFLFVEFWMFFIFIEILLCFIFRFGSLNLDFFFFFLFGVFLMLDILLLCNFKLCFCSNLEKLFLESFFVILWVFLFWDELMCLFGDEDGINDDFCFILLFCVSFMIFSRDGFFDLFIFSSFVIFVYFVWWYFCFCCFNLECDCVCV